MEEPLCPMGRALDKIVHSPDRLLYPMKKEKDGWRRISWDEALRFTAERLNDIKRKYGPQAIDIHTGYAATHYDLREYVRRFTKLFGTPNLSSSGGQCHTAKLMGNVLTCGALPLPDYERTNCIIVWGYNPAASNPYAMRAILNARKRGAKLITVDPRIIPPAARSDIHLQLRPGTDRALALGMLNVVIREGLYDKDFVTRWTLDFDKLEEAIRIFTPEHVQDVTGVPADLIKKAAYMYGSTSPACIVLENAPEHQIDGIQSIRAISILQAISGNLDVPGGALINSEYGFADMSLADITLETKSIGADTYPLFHEFKREAHANLLADAVLEEKPYALKGMIISGANPVLTFPNSNKLKKALEKLEFLAVSDIFLTETAGYADVILPATTFLERMELCDLRQQRYFPRFALIKQAVAQQGESWPDWKIWFELAKLMGYGEYFSWESIKEATAFKVKPAGISIEQLEKEPDGIQKGYGQYKKYEQKGFSTPSGKVEIYSERLAGHGYDPLPTYPVSNDHDGTIILSVGARVNQYIHSRFRNIRELRLKRPEPFAEISVQTAQQLDIQNNEVIKIITKTGEIEIKAKIADSVLPGTVFVPHGWAEANGNILVDDSYLDPISGFPVSRAIPCSVKKTA